MGEVPEHAARGSELVPLEECGGGSACEECTYLCHSLHWSRNDLYPIVNRFFKIMIGPDWNRFMSLPPKFEEIVKDLVGQETVLKDAIGQKWTVTLSSSSVGLAFRRGWPAFVLDHNITMGDFLVFNYIRGSHFAVQIFGRSGCEKKCSGHQFKGIAQAKPCHYINSDAMNVFQPSAKDGTHVSGGGNAKSPCSDNSSSLMVGQDRPSPGDLSSFQMHENKRAADSEAGIDAGVRNFNPATVMRSQAEGSKDFIGAENLNSNIFTKDTDVSVIEKEKILEFKDDGTPGCDKEPLVIIPSSPPLGPSCGEPAREGNDWSSPCAEENSGQKFTEAGDINKMATEEQQETSERARSRSKRKRGLQPSRHVDATCKRLMLEPLDVPSSYRAAVTCLAVTDSQNYLELPAKLPDVKFRKGGGESKSLVLKDQEGRLWPALYHARSNVHVLISKWDKVNQKNGILAGDTYVFEVENSSESMYRINVHRQ